MNNPLEPCQLAELIQKELDGSLTDQEFVLLHSLLSNDPRAVDYYVKTILSVSALSSVASDFSLDLNDDRLAGDLSDSTVWKSLAAMEETAPRIEIPKEESSRELVQKVVYPMREKRKVSKFNLFVLAVNAAAILFLVLFLKYAPPKGGNQVATLSDSINAKWADVTTPMEKGMRLATGNLWLLREGLAELEFDNNTKVTLEGPAEFRILTQDRISLNYGKVYSRVPQEAIGFSVYTPNAKIIDLGTEFGVQADLNGNTYLHVIRGATTLISNNGSNKVRVDVTEGNARKISGITSEVSAIPCETNLFARQIESKMHIIWRGQTTFDLAGIVAGGNGFVNGQRNMGLNPLTGEMTGILQEDINRQTPNTYHRIKSTPFIDGVFVPNGQTEQVISSLGHVFSECPTTGGNFYTEICLNPEVVDRAEVILGETNYSQSKSPALFLHPNLGITFDLQAIRSQLAGTKISNFRSIIGICNSAWRPCNADFWILVDGQLRYSKLKVQQKGVIDTVDIKLSDNDHFLTLVTTDGGDSNIPPFENGSVTSIDSDWCIFGKPVLVLE